MKQVTNRCTQHLEKLQRGEVELLNGVDMELIEIKLKLTPLVQEITKVIQTGAKSSRLAPTAFFIMKFLDLNALDQLFRALSWAAQAMIEYEKVETEKKLLIHQSTLHECLLAPMNLISILICGEYLKRHDIKYFLTPNELSPLIAIYKLRLNMMRQLVQPVVMHFFEEKAELYLTIADKYDKEFSRLLEGVLCVLAANSFFNTNSGFDGASLRQV